MNNVNQFILKWVTRIHRKFNYKFTGKLAERLLRRQMSIRKANGVKEIQSEVGTVTCLQDD